VASWWDGGGLIGEKIRGLGGGDGSGGSRKKIIGWTQVIKQYLHFKLILNKSCSTEYNFSYPIKLE
jgi:hypothetical protein